MKKYIVIAATLLLVGCTTTFYSGIVSVTEIRRSVINEYGEVYRTGNVPQAVDMRMEMADASYRMAAKSLQLSLIAYKNGTSTNDPMLKLEMVKQPVRDMIDILTMFVSTKTANQHVNDLNKATKL